MNKNSKIFLAGSSGMVGSSILNVLKKSGFSNIVTSKRKNLDLKNQSAVDTFFKKKSFDHLIITAAKVGGIYDNINKPAEFILDNLQIQNNLIHNAYKNNIKKLLFLGSSCIYPAITTQPIYENQLLTGLPEKTNEYYAIAKIAGIKLCEAYNKQYKTDFRCIMPTNLYGPNDNFNLLNSHVVPALIHKFYNAKIKNKKYVDVLGSGKARRDFLHVDDLSNACLHVMSLSKKKYLNLLQNKNSHINVGSGTDITINNLAYLIKKIMKYDGNLRHIKNKQEGMVRKLLSNKLINSTGWYPKINIEKGLKETILWFEKNYNSKFIRL